MLHAQKAPANGQAKSTSAKAWWFFRDEGLIFPHNSGTSKSRGDGSNDAVGEFCDASKKDWFHARV
jgi:hypothetical protein